MLQFATYQELNWSNVLTAVKLLTSKLLITFFKKSENKLFYLKNLFYICSIN
jgi:hypothetical protein